MYLKIGGIVLRLEGTQEVLASVKTPALKEFFVKSGSTDAAYLLKWGQISDFPQSGSCYDPGGVWRLYQEKDQSMLFIYTDKQRKQPYHQAILRNNFTSGEIILAQYKIDPRSSPSPLRPPMDELLFLNLLSSGLGGLFHGCGVMKAKNAYIFLGKSGSGKSTLARLLNKKYTILSEDRLIIRRQRNIFKVYGTPWHGEQGFRSPLYGRLKKIFFLGPRSLKPKSTLQKGVKAVSKLLTTCFLPLWSSSGMNYTTYLCTELAQYIPCYLLQITLNNNTIKYIESFLKED
jgi:hypothetical protein